MKNLKKLLAIFLSIAMVMCSTLPSFASETEASSKSTEYVEETETTVGDDILSPHDDEPEESEESRGGELDESEESRRGEHCEPAEETEELSESDYAEEPEEDETTAAVEESEEEEMTEAAEEESTTTEESSSGELDESEETSETEETSEDNSVGASSDNDSVGASSASPEETSEPEETTAPEETSEDNSVGTSPEEETIVAEETLETAEIASPSELIEIAAEANDKLLGATATPWMYWWTTTTTTGTTIHFSSSDPGGANPIDCEDNEAISYGSLDKSSITKAVFEDNITAVTCESFFQGFRNLTIIDGLEKLTTNNVKSMKNMFSNCENLKYLDLGSFNTSNVEFMEEMFSGCISLKTIIVSNEFSITKVGDNGVFMFVACDNLYGCNGTQYAHGSNNKEYACIDGVPSSSTHGYFSSAPWMYWYLTDSDGDSTYETINYTGTKPTSGNYEIVTRRDQVVYNDLTKSDITNAVFDNNITPVTCESFFEGFTNLTKIDGLEKLTTNNVKSMKKMFYGCNKLKYLDLLGFNTSNVELMREMFKDCSSLITIISNDFDTTHLTAGEDADMFSGCSKLVGCKGTVYESAHVTKDRARIDEGSSSNKGYFSSAPWMYWYLMDSDGDSTYETIKYTNSKPTSGDYGFVTRADRVLYNGLEKDDIKKAVFDIDVNAVTCTEFFKGFTNLKEVQGIGKLKKEATKDMHRMFLDCSSLENIDLRDFDVGNVQSIIELFSGCSSLETVYLGERVTIAYTDPRQWFYNCSSLTTIYVLNDNFFISLHTSNMFYGCVNLVGGAGTTYDSSRTDSTYARIDGGPSSATPGYFTLYVPPTPPTPPAPYYPGGSSGSSGSSGGGGGGGGGGPVTEDTPAVTYLPYVKSIIGFANNLMSKWSQDAMSSKWKLSVTAENGSEMNLKNGFVLYTHISTQIVGIETVQTAANNTYVFDENGNMITGWVHTADGKTYFFENKKTKDEGKMIIGWKQIQGSWYCFGPDGAMYKDTITPDGHPVGPDGKWRG